MSRPRNLEDQLQPKLNLPAWKCRSESKRRGWAELLVSGHVERTSEQEWIANGELIVHRAEIRVIEQVRALGDEFATKAGIPVNVERLRQPHVEGVETGTGAGVARNVPGTGVEVMTQRAVGGARNANRERNPASQMHYRRHRDVRKHSRPQRFRGTGFERRVVHGVGHEVVRNVVSGNSPLEIESSREE